ncbi:hypothetical protein tf_04 [Pseudomonas phage tf]|uniref:Uncharacterized protein n=1 Tax=Pseudomonas phage tf TaxID=1114179 RepID=I2FLM5_9CAUD|nr:hypothetical protein tf_04 [Pseudomonas phage tf]CCE60759.1 hypothetical protein tf_04 [Pseudomonas phage tf]
MTPHVRPMETIMHHHHARALRIARRNYLFCRGVVARRIEEEQRIRSMYLANAHNGAAVRSYYFAKVKSAVRSLELALVELQNQLSVLMTVERLLEKA